jgi:hypothetical protein
VWAQLVVLPGALDGRPVGLLELLRVRVGSGDQSDVVEAAAHVLPVCLCLANQDPRVRGDLGAVGASAAKLVQASTWTRVMGLRAVGLAEIGRVLPVWHSV